jgi:hypothetical protein
LSISLLNFLLTLTHTLLQLDEKSLSLFEDGASGRDWTTINDSVEL